MSINLNRSYYELLEVPKTATESEIRAAYKKQALKYHPDKVNQDASSLEKATAAFKQVSEAYETLSDQQKRRAYDLKTAPKIFTSTPTSTYSKENFFGEAFHFYNRTHDFGNKNKCEDEVLSPCTMDKEANGVINSDDCGLLDQLLKSKSFNDSFIKSMLYEACQRGRFNIVKYLIEVRKLSPHLKINDGFIFTGLIFKAAAESGNLELVKYLLEVHHVDIESQGPSSGKPSTALSKAAAKGHESIVEYLILKGANLNPEVSYSNLLEQAINSKKISVVKLVVEAGTKIKNFHLQRALGSGVLTIVQYLLQKRPGIKTHLFNSSPGFLAVVSGNVELVKYLEEVEGLDLFEKHRSSDDSFGLILEAGANSCRIEMMKFLLEERGLEEKVVANDLYVKKFLIAALKGNISIKFLQFLMEEKQLILPQDKLKLLIEDSAKDCGIRVNSYLQSYLSENAKSKKLLQVIALQGLAAVNFADLLKLYNSDIITKGKCCDFKPELHHQIKERKIDLDQLRSFFLENKEMMTEALFYFSSYYYDEDLAPLKLLLELGVDLNTEDADGIAAIHLAISSGGYNKIVKFYVDHKVDLSKKNKHGTTAAEILK